MAHYMQRRRGVELRAIRPPRPIAEDGFRWCGRCRQFVDADDFAWDKSRDQPARTCRPCRAEEQAAYVTQNREQINLRRRLVKYGLTNDAFQAMLTDQQGRCAVCERERPLDIDHCHKQGHVRALLCGPCNRALGFLEDDPEIAEKAVAFLRLHTVVTS